MNCPKCGTAGGGNPACTECCDQATEDDEDELMATGEIYGVLATEFGPRCARCAEQTTLRCRACGLLLCRDHSQVVGPNRFCLEACPAPVPGDEPGAWTCGACGRNADRLCASCGEDLCGACAAMANEDDAYCRDCAAQ